MNKRLSVASMSVLLLALLTAIAAAEVRHEIAIPDLPDYQTLKCDFHMHSVFSDGSVWPTVRVGEAWRQGLDAISLTDHIEYQPHKDDLPTNHNRPYNLTAGGARQMNLLFPRGTEITRDTPPGHFNAIFLKDVDPLDVEDFVEAIKRANAQGAFVFWNHQGWKGSEKGRWLDVHTTIYDNKWLHGMEVCNSGSYYPDAHRWCLEKNLTMMGNSDIHAPDLRERSTTEGHRTMTLVFVQQRSLTALQEALVAGRTAVWFKDQIIGRREWLEPLLAQCIRVGKPHLVTDKAVYLEVQNTSDVDIHAVRTGKVGPGEVTLPARTTGLVKINVARSAEPLVLSYTVANFLIAPGKGLPVTLTISAP